MQYAHSMEARFIPSKEYDGYFRLLIEVEGITFESQTVHKVKDLRLKGFKETKA